MVAEKSGYGSLHVWAKTNTQATVVGKVKDSILIVTASLLWQLTLFLFSYKEKNNKNLAKTDPF